MTNDHQKPVSQDAITEKLTDALTPGYQAEFDPEEADRAGAFKEEALEELDALESCEDLPGENDEPLSDH